MCVKKLDRDRTAAGGFWFKGQIRIEEECTQEEEQMRPRATTDHTSKTLQME